MKKYATLLDQRKIFIATISTYSPDPGAKHQTNGVAGCGLGAIGTTWPIMGCISIVSYPTG